MKKQCSWCRTGYYFKSCLCHLKNLTFSLYRLLSVSPISNFGAFSKQAQENHVLSRAELIFWWTLASHHKISERNLINPWQTKSVACLPLAHFNYSNATSESILALLTRRSSSQLTDSQQVESARPLVWRNVQQLRHKLQTLRLWSPQ